MIRNVLFLMLIALISSVSLSAQKKNVSKELDTYYTEALKGESYFVSGEVIRAANPGKLLKKSVLYLKDENASVRYKAIDLIKRKGLLTSDTLYRQQYVAALIDAVKDRDGGNCGAALRGLTFFKPGDFNRASRDRIKKLLQVKSPHYELLIKIAGFINDPETKVILEKTLAEDSILNGKTKWALHLALARMGDKSNLAYCIGKVKSVPMSDQVVNYLFPDLVYIRQKEALQYMLDAVLSDQKSCTSPNPDSDADIICAFKIIEIVGPVISNFPLPYENGEVIMENYDKALLTVREWIESKPELEIIKNIY